MGTSKGYIAPTKVEWSKAKRDVTNLISEPNALNISKSISSYATAMKSDGFLKSTLPKTIAGILNIARQIKLLGIEETLENIGRIDLKGKSNQEIFDELLLIYTNNGATKEDSLALDALSLALKNLEINDIEDLKNINEDKFLREILAEFIGLNFEFRFYEKIAKTKTPQEVRSVMLQIKKYLRGVIYEQLKIEQIEAIDFSNLAQEEHIGQVCKDAFTILEII